MYLESTKMLLQMISKKGVINTPKHKILAIELHLHSAQIMIVLRLLAIVSLYVLHTNRLMVS